MTASGDQLPILDHVSALVQVGELHVRREFVVTEGLVAPVILGVDFLHEHALLLDFTKAYVQVRHANVGSNLQSIADFAGSQIRPIYEAARKIEVRACTIAAIEQLGTDVLDECAVPMYQEPISIELPQCPKPSLSSIVQQHQTLFRTVPGVTEAAQHFIPTTGNPVKVPPHRIPAHYRENGEKQIRTMLAQGIIEESSNPWMAPDVFVPKTSCEIRLCIDYRELNKKTTKDAYPLPLPDEVQDQLSGSTVFSTLDLQSGYWQLPVSPNDPEKTAFCPGPGMGLFQFCRMPFGLTGAPSSFQRLMDNILRGLSFVTIYLDDILVHSRDEKMHCQHLNEVFQRLTAAGLTLRGRKCHIGLSHVSYLGHVFTGSGMLPDPQKIEAIVQWGQPTDATAVHQFLDLASYYRRYIQKFSDIAAPLNVLTQKCVPFVWTQECTEAFTRLKKHLVRAPILAYPTFHPNSKEFVLQTDASAVGLGAVLEQGGYVIAMLVGR